MPEEVKKCTIYYNIGVTSDEHHIYYAFAGMSSCCARFEDLFRYTGNDKTNDFNKFVDASTNIWGLYLVSTVSVGSPAMAVRFVWMERDSDSYIDNRVRNCQFCGAQIETRLDKTFHLKEEIRLVTGDVIKTASNKKAGETDTMEDHSNCC